MDIDKAFKEFVEEELNIEAAFAEAFGLDERKMTDGEKEEREEIVKKLKPKLQSFKDRYGDDAKKVMYATATKQAMEEVEINEVKFEAGKVYHQEFKNGDKAYFRADSVQKNKRWKGMQVDEFGGKQKKAKNATANENLPGWATTPKNEIPKGLKEEVEKRWTGGKLPPHLAKFFDKDGNLKKDAADRIAKGRAKLNWKDVTPKGYGPKEEFEATRMPMSAPFVLKKEEVEEASTYRDKMKDDEKKKKKGKGGITPMSQKKKRWGSGGYG